MFNQTDFFQAWKVYARWVFSLYKQNNIHMAGPVMSLLYMHTSQWWGLNNISFNYNFIWHSLVGTQKIWLQNFIWIWNMKDESTDLTVSTDQLCNQISNQPIEISFTTVVPTEILIVHQLLGSLTTVLHTSTWSLYTNILNQKQLGKSLLVFWCWGEETFKSENHREETFS